jgi:hypothetical protein
MKNKKLKLNFSCDDEVRSQKQFGTFPLIPGCFAMFAMTEICCFLMIQ